MQTVKISALTETIQKANAYAAVAQEGESKKYNLSNLATQTQVTTIETAVGQIADDYVTRTSAQTISGLKTFSNGFKIGSSTLAYDTTNECITITFA